MLRAGGSRKGQHGVGRSGNVEHRDGDTGELGEMKQEEEHQDPARINRKVGDTLREGQSLVR